MTIKDCPLLQGSPLFKVNNGTRKGVQNSVEVVPFSEGGSNGFGSIAHPFLEINARGGEKRVDQIT